MKLKIERGIFWMRVKTNEISLTNGQWKISRRNRLKPTKDRGHILDDPSGSYWRVVNSYWQKHEEYGLHAYRATFCYLCWRTLYSSLVSSTFVFQTQKQNSQSSVSLLLFFLHVICISNILLNIILFHAKTKCKLFFF